MSNINTNDLRSVRRFTQAGFADCQAALQRQGGDTYLAIRELLSRDQILEAYRSMQVRKAAGRSISNPPSREEIQLVDRLYRDVILKQPSSPWWRRLLGKVLRTRPHYSCGPQPATDGRPVKLRVYCSGDFSERLVSDQATPDVVHETMDSLDWQEFHLVSLEHPNGNWLEVGGSLSDGLCITYMENDQQHFMAPPTRVEQLTSVLVEYLGPDTS